MKANVSRVRRCVVYARVSTDEQTRGEFASCAAQLQAGRRDIKEREAEGFKLVGELADEGWSGENLDRPSMCNLLKRVKAREVDVIVVTHLDRLTRNTADLETLIVLLNRHNVELRALRHAAGMRTSAERTMLRMTGIIAQAEREEGSERAVSKQKESIRAGRFTGGRITWGYRSKGSRGGLEVDETEATLVREVFQRVAAGEAFSVIATDFNARGLRTPRRTERGPDRKERIRGNQPFRSDFLQAIVRRTAYRGVRLSPFSEKGEEFPTLHPGIVEPDLWHAANARFAGGATSTDSTTDRITNRDKHENVLKGLVVCGDCGFRMVPSAPKKRRSDGSLFRYYTCTKWRRNRECGCHVRNIPADGLERAVFAFLGEVCRYPELIRQILGASSEVVARESALKRTRLKQLGGEIEDAAHEIENLVAAVRKGGSAALTSVLRESLESLTTHRVALKAEAEKTRQWIKQSEVKSFDRASLTATLKRFGWLVGHLSIEKRRELIGLFVRKIEVEAVRDVPSKDRTFRVVMFLEPLNLPGATGEQSDISTIEEPKRRVLGKQHQSLGTRVEFGVKFSSWRDRNAVEIIHPFSVAHLPSLARSKPAVTLNASKRKLHPMVQALEWEAQMLENPKLRAIDIAQVSGRTKASVSQHLSLLELDPQVKDRFRTVPLRPQVAAVSLRRLMALRRLSREEQKRQFREWTRQHAGDKADAVA